MNTFEKIYIGKGKANKKLANVVTISIAMEEAEAFIFEYEGKKYLRFEVAERKNPDKFGNTHTAYVLARIETEPAVRKPVAKRFKPTKA